MWDVITCPWLGDMFLAHHSSYFVCNHDDDAHTLVPSIHDPELFVSILSYSFELYIKKVLLFIYIIETEWLPKNHFYQKVQLR